jgi:hypothetical protein
MRARLLHPKLCLNILDALIESLPGLPEEMWRAIYGASEASYLCRHFDDGLGVGSAKSTRFQHCARTYFDHDNCDVRGLLVENMAFFVEHPDEGQYLGNQGKRTQYPKDFEIEIRRWLIDTDVWVLEHVHQTFAAIRERQRVDLTLGGWVKKQLKYVEDHPDCLLARLGPSWHSMERGEFLTSLGELQESDVQRG